MLNVVDFRQFKRIFTPKKIKRYSFFSLNNPYFFFLFMSNSFHLMIIVIQSVRFSNTSHHVYNKRIQKLCTDLIFSLLPFFFSFTHSSHLLNSFCCSHEKKNPYYSHHNPDNTTTRTKDKMENRVKLSRIKNVYNIIM